jgi:hypothetical protein
MSSPRTAALTLCVALVSGTCAGVLTRLTEREGPASPPKPSGPAEAAASAAVPAANPLPAAAPEFPPALTEGLLPNASEPSDFSRLEFGKQKDLLARLSERFSKGEPCPPGLEIWIGRLAKNLQADQAAALLEALPKTKPEEDPLRSVLASRLAAADPQRALELGKKLEDSTLLSAAVAAVAARSGAEALLTLAALPEDKRSAALDAVGQGELLQVGGAFSQMAEALKANPQLLSGPGSWKMNQFLGAALAKEALTDPAAALAQVRALAAEVEKNLPADSGGGGPYGGRRGGRRGGPDGQPAVSQQLLASTIASMRTASGEGASALFESLNEKEKAPWMMYSETVARYRRDGVDAAVAFAEKQPSEEMMRASALATWWTLAQKDRPSAIEWISALPEGSFRQGALSAVRIDAWNQSASWGSQQAAIDAGMALQSKAVQLDYFANMMTERPGFRSTMSRSETLALIPLPDSEKAELVRRVAPIKPQ